MMIMKNIVKRVLSFMMVLMLVMMAVPVSEVWANDEEDIGGGNNGSYPESARYGTITLNNITNGDTFEGYKIIDIIYDQGSDSVSYEWIEGIEDAIKSANNRLFGENKALTVEEFAKCDHDKRQKLLSDVPVVIKDWSPDLTSKSATGNSVSWESVSLGGYFIVPTSTTDVYQTILISVQPVYDGLNNKYVTRAGSITDGGQNIDGETTVKKNPITIDKNVNGDETSTTGDIKVITYTIEVDVPVYEVIGENISKVFKVGDIMGDGLQLINGNITDSSLNIYLKDGENEYGTDPIDDSKYTIKTTDFDFENYDEATFEIVFDYDKLISGTNSTNRKVKIEYNAELSNSASCGTYTNKAVVEYSYYPFEEENIIYSESESNVSTYKLQINKKDSSNDNPLTGAEFDLYLKVDNNATEDNLGDRIDTDEYTSGIYQNDLITALGEGKYIRIGEFSEVGNGVYSIDKLDAGEYAIVETKAPTGGYSLPSKAFTITIPSQDDGNVKDDYIFEKNIPNSMGFTLPETGGTGTVIFTVVGVSLMCVAVLAFFILRKKEMSKN